MLATERATVAELNQLARAHLVARGDIVRRSRTYCAPDDHRTITLAVGDLVILRRNRRITQPDRTTTAVRNGMTGRVTATRRRAVTVELDAVHRTPGGPAAVTLPAGYVGAHVDYGYARTVDTAQGATVDHSLFAPSTGASAERAYVALSRGRLTNRIYAHPRPLLDRRHRPRPQPRPGHRPDPRRRSCTASSRTTARRIPGRRTAPAPRDRPVDSLSRGRRRG
jgi:ATP-dependent exoDNAse (exonuclease V) alpha subunit